MLFLSTDKAIWIWVFRNIGADFRNLLNINGNKYTPNTILNGWCQKILILKS